jgi:hypothetical protein
MLPGRFTPRRTPGGVHRGSAEGGPRWWPEGAEPPCVSRPPTRCRTPSANRGGFHLSATEASIRGSISPFVQYETLYPFITVRGAGVEAVLNTANASGHPSRFLRLSLDRGRGPWGCHRIVALVVEMAGVGAVRVPRCCLGGCFLGGGRCNCVPGRDPARRHSRGNSSR